MPGERNIAYEEYLPGQYRFRDMLTGRFASGEDYLSSLTTSIHGFRGYQGRFQPYAVIEQELGPGIPTPAHTWWRAPTSIVTPVEDLRPTVGRQYQITGTFITPEGVPVTQDFFTPIGAGFSVSEAEASVLSFARSHEAYPVSWVLGTEEWYELVGVSVTQIDWRMVGVPEE